MPGPAGTVRPDLTVNLLQRCVLSTRCLCFHVSVVDSYLCGCYGVRDVGIADSRRLESLLIQHAQFNSDPDRMIRLFGFDSMVVEQSTWRRSPNKSILENVLWHPLRPSGSFLFFCFNFISRLFIGPNALIYYCYSNLIPPPQH